MFNGKSINEKFLPTRKYYDFACAINCTCKLICVCACACMCDRMRLGGQYGCFITVLTYSLTVSVWWVRFDQSVVIH